MPPRFSRPAPVPEEDENFSYFSVAGPLEGDGLHDEFIVLRGDYVLRTGVDAADHTPAEIETLLAVALSFDPK